MHVYLVKASAPGPFKEYKKAMGAPPQNIFSVAAATPAGIKIEMCDETIGMRPKLRIKADIVAIFFHTPDAPHAYKLADKYRAKGKTVVLGGLHVSFMPDEAEGHADSLLIGEAEEIWEELLNDYSTDNLKKRYEREKPIDLSLLKPYPTDIIAPSKYGHLWSVVVSRGCPHKCEYCTVPRFFKGKYQLRPIENIVEEIRLAPTEWFELHADNLTANREYALKLFNALIPLKIHWFGESTIKMADDEELLQAAADSGCQSLLIGIETPSQAALNETGKGFVAPEDIKEKIANFHKYGIEVSSSMIFGFDTHTNEIFSESEEFCRFIEIDEVEGVLLIPFPGTPLFKRLDAENRILTKDWSLYDGSNVVYQPVKMEKEVLEKGFQWFWDTIRKNKNIRLTTSTNPLTDYVRLVSKKNKPSPVVEKAPLKEPVPKEERSRPSSTVGGGIKSWLRRQKWKALFGLSLIGIGLAMDWYWVWGILFLIWAVGDIRSKQTHLLEGVTRSESPILYWIIIVLWIFFGVYALGTAPVFASETVQKVLSTELSSQNIQDVTYKFSLQIPAHWSITDEQRDSYSHTYTIESLKKDASVTVVGVKFEAQLELRSFKKEMDKQMSKNLPFIGVSPSKKPMPVVQLAESVPEMEFEEYTEKWNKHEVTVLVGHCVQGNFGYTMVAMYAKENKKMAKIIREIFGKFILVG